MACTPKRLYCAVENNGTVYVHTLCPETAKNGSSCGDFVEAMGFVALSYIAGRVFVWAKTGPWSVRGEDGWGCRDGGRVEGGRVGEREREREREREVGHTSIA